MKRAFLIFTGIVLIAMSGLVSSCSKKEQPAKKELPAGHEKIIGEMTKGMEQAKKIEVATVNGNKITMAGLIREMNAIGPRFLRPGEKPTPEIKAEVRKRALDNVIFRKLAVEEARKQGMEVPPGVVEKNLQELKRRLGSEEAYKVYSARMMATDDDMKKILGNEYLFRMIITKEIFDKVKEPDMSQIKEAYRKEKLMMPEKFIADDVFFSGGNVADLKKKAEGVLASIKANQGDLSKLSPGSAVVGQKTITKSTFPELYNALEKMKPGGITGIIEARDGLHILKLRKKEAARRMTFDEAKNILARHLKFQAIEKRKEAWEAQLKKNATIKITMKEGEYIKPSN